MSVLKYMFYFLVLLFYINNLFSMEASDGLERRHNVRASVPDLFYNPASMSGKPSEEPLLTQGQRSDGEDDERHIPVRARQGDTRNRFSCDMRGASARFFSYADLPLIFLLNAAIGTLLYHGKSINPDLFVPIDIYVPSLFIFIGALFFDAHSRKKDGLCYKAVRKNGCCYNYLQVILLLLTGVGAEFLDRTILQKKFGIRTNWGLILGAACVLRLGKALRDLPRSSLEGLDQEAGVSALDNHPVLSAQVVGQLSRNHNFMEMLSGMVDHAVTESFSVAADDGAGAEAYVSAGLLGADPYSRGGLGMSHLEPSPGRPPSSQLPDARGGTPGRASAGLPKTIDVLGSDGSGSDGV